MGRKRQSYFSPEFLRLFLLLIIAVNFGSHRLSCFEWRNLSLFGNECFFPQQPLTCISYPLAVIYINIAALFAYKYQEFKMQSRIIHHYRVKVVTSHLILPHSSSPLAKW